VRERWRGRGKCHINNEKGKVEKNNLAALVGQQGEILFTKKGKAEAEKN